MTGRLAAPGVRVVAVDVAAEDEPALVGLADVEVPGAEGHDTVDRRLDALRDESLQNMAFDRQPQARQRPDARGVARDRKADLARPDRAARRVEPRDTAVADINAGHLAVLDDVDAAHIGAARIAPHHGIVPRRAAAPLQQAAVDREARVLEIEVRHHAAHALAIEQRGIDAMQPHRVAAPRVSVALRVRVIEVEHAALAHHRIVIEVLLQPFPELHR